MDMTVTLPARHPLRAVWSVVRQFARAACGAAHTRGHALAVVQAPEPLMTVGRTAAWPLTVRRAIDNLLCRGCDRHEIARRLEMPLREVDEVMAGRWTWSPTTAAA